MAYIVAAVAAATDTPQSDAAAPNAELRLRTFMAEQQLSALKATLDDMREQRDKWKAQAERQAGLVTDQRPRQSWWRYYEQDELRQEHPPGRLYGYDFAATDSRRRIARY
jgi:hypothetical protein